MILDAILKINPNAKVHVFGSDIETCEIRWLEGTPEISKEDIQAQFSNVEVDNALLDLRRKRNRLLKQTDYLALSDRTLSTEMANYRQQLRDITNDLTTVEEIEAVVFPTKP